ncbi:MAG: Mpo1-like protein [Betaproteobacteria bacterium]
MRRVDRLFERYAQFHRDPVNKAMHWVCVPLIVWSVLGMLWAASPIAACAAIAAATWFYLRLSVPLAFGMLAILATMVWTVTLLGDRVLLVSLITFAVAWIGQFIGHGIEGKKPAFVDDLRSFLVAPAWLLGDLYRRLGLRY